MKRILAIMCAVATLSAATTTVFATTASTGINTTGAQNQFIAPATHQTEVNINGAITAPPNFSFDVATQLAETRVALVAPPNEIAFTDTRVCPADGRTEANFVKALANHVPAPEDVGKVVFTGNIGTMGVYDGISGYTNYALGGGACNIAVAIIAPVKA